MSATKSRLGRAIATRRCEAPAVPACRDHGRYVDGTLLDDFANNDVLPAQLTPDAHELNGVRDLAYAVLELAAFDRYRYRRRRAGRVLEPWMLIDGWTPADGREAETWLDTFGDKEQPFTLAWVRLVLRRL